MTVDVIRGSLRLEGTRPIERMKLVLFLAEDNEAPVIFRDKVVWEMDGSGTMPAKLDLDVAMDLASPVRGSVVYPTIPKFTSDAGATIQIAYQLRLVVEPVCGAEAWNTLSVRLTRTKPRGVPRGTLSVKKPPKVEGRALFFALVKEVCACVP